MTLKTSSTDAPSSVAARLMQADAIANQPAPKVELPPMPATGPSAGVLGGLKPNTTGQATKEATDAAIDANDKSAFHTDRKDASDIRRMGVEAVGKIYKDTVRNFKH
jgi:hypothetical protein